MAISRQQLDEIRDRVDIVDLIGSYIQLKRAGTAFKALCPFHREKTPSFTVSPTRQTFHCFGCGAGGDAFKFVMLHENVEFPEAIRLLAQRAGVVLQQDDAARGEDARKDVLYKMHAEAATFFQEILKQSRSAEAARDYLRERRLGPDLIDAFGIGYAPSIDDLIRTWGSKRGYDDAALEQGGLLARDESGRAYDRFRERVMFPVRDLSGRVIAFSGRILPGDPRGSKYLNSPETPIFRKSRVLYAMDRARKAMLDSRTAVLCEGQIDVIRCHASGVENAVAGLGTALTEEHARLLKRNADNVVLLMDADSAGQTSAIRSAGIFLQGELAVQVATLPPGEDPDSLVVKEGPEALQRIVRETIPLVSFQVRVLAGREDLRTEAGLRRAVRAVVETIRNAGPGVQQDQLFREASRELGFPEDKLRLEMDRLRGRPASPVEPADVAAPASEPAPPEERDLLRLLLHHPDTADLIARYLTPDVMTHTACRELTGLLLAHAAGQIEDLAAAAREAGESCVALLAETEAEQPRFVGADDPEGRAAKDIILVLRRRAAERRRRELVAEREKAAPDVASRLSHEIAQLVHDISTYKSGWDKALPLLDLDA